MVRRVLRAVEFYSGIGGWAYAAQLACGGMDDVEIRIVLSIDVSTVCNEIYAANLDRSPAQRRVESLKPEELENVDVWLMSPPCQPHTRQGSTLDDLDPRSVSLAALCELVEICPPKEFVCLENVIGFRGSKSWERWRHATRDTFEVNWWELSPVDLGKYPCQRPRYFECAYRGHRRRPEVALVSLVEEERTLSDCLVEDLDESLLLGSEVLGKSSAWCLDVVTRDSSRPVACFTRSYGRFIRGTGSVLCVDYDEKNLREEFPELARGGEQNPAEREYEKIEKWPRLRYFAPKEIANILGFPEKFMFPSHTTRKAQWASLGNSLHVPTAAAVLKFALSLQQSYEEETR